MARNKVRPQLSSSRLFEQSSSKDLSSGKVDDTYYNYMTASFENKEYLEDSFQFSLAAPVLYQLDLLKDDIDDLHAEVSASSYTETINSGSFVSEIKTFTSRDTTPSVKHGTLFKTNNDRPISITDFDDGTSGQQITIIMGCDNTGFTHNRTKLMLSGAANVLRFYTGDTISFVYDGSKWYETNRSDNT